MHERSCLAVLALAAAAACSSPVQRAEPPLVSRSEPPTMIASRGPSSAELERFAATIDEMRRDARIPGLALAVVYDGEVVLARGLGHADLETQRPVTESTPFVIASVTKPMAGVVTMRLVELGVLDLDRPMHTYEGFGEFCDDARSDGGIFFSDHACEDPALSLRHLLTMRANGRPGERFYYNPPSFSWASRPMMEVTGKPFSTLVDEHVLRPAGMTHAARIHRGLPLRDDLAASLALPYHVDARGDLVRSPDPPPQGDGAAGGVVASVLDVARFDVALDAGALIDAASREAMWTPPRDASGRPAPYALGWYVQEHAGHRLLWHSGWWEQAYSAIYLKVPDARLTLVLLANSEGLWWSNPLDAATIEDSPFAAAFLRELVGVPE